MSLPAEVVSASTSEDPRHWVLRVRAQIERGSSGSPMLNSKGEVLGVLSRGAVDMPKGAALAQQHAASSALLEEAEFGAVIPAAPAAAFARAVELKIIKAAVSGSPSEAAMVRVFCFLRSTG